MTESDNALEKDIFQYIYQSLKFNEDKLGLLRYQVNLIMKDNIILIWLSKRILDKEMVEVCLDIINFLLDISDKFKEFFSTSEFQNLYDQIEDLHNTSSIINLIKKIRFEITQFNED